MLNDEELLVSNLSLKVLRDDIVPKIRKILSKNLRCIDDCKAIYVEYPFDFNAVNSEIGVNNHGCANNNSSNNNSNKNGINSTNKNNSDNSNKNDINKNHGNHSKSKSNNKLQTLLDFITTSMKQRFFGDSNKQFPGVNLSLHYDMLRISMYIEGKWQQNIYRLPKFEEEINPEAIDYLPPAMLVMDKDIALVKLNEVNSILRKKERLAIFFYYGMVSLPLAVPAAILWVFIINGIVSLFSSDKDKQEKFFPWFANAICIAFIAHVWNWLCNFTFIFKKYPITMRHVLGKPIEYNILALIYLVPILLVTVYSIAYRRYMDDYIALKFLEEIALATLLIPLSEFFVGIAADRLLHCCSGIKRILPLMFSTYFTFMVWVLQLPSRFIVVDIFEKRIHNLQYQAENKSHAMLPAILDNVSARFGDAIISGVDYMTAKTILLDVDDTLATALPLSLKKMIIDFSCNQQVAKVFRMINLQRPQRSIGDKNFCIIDNVPELPSCQALNCQQPAHYGSISASIS